LSHWRGRTAIQILSVDQDQDQSDKVHGKEQLPPEIKSNHRVAGFVDCDKADAVAKY